MSDAPRYRPDLPPLADLAYERARKGGFGADGPTLSSKPGTGALLAVLAASRPGGRFAELGTGLGAGAASIAHGMDLDARLVTVEIDAGRAEEARALLRDDGRIDVVTGDWLDVLPSRGPFDLVYVDSGYSQQLADPEAADMLLGIVVPGGLMVLDDLTPEVERPLAGATDPKREFAFRNPHVVGVELYPPSLDGVLGGAQTGLLVMTKRNKMAEAASRAASHGPE